MWIIGNGDGLASMHKMGDGKKGGRRFLVQIGHIGLNAGVLSVGLLSWLPYILLFWWGEIYVIGHVIE